MTERKLDVLKTPAKDDCESSDFAETPVTTETRRNSLIILSMNKQDPPVSKSAKSDDSSSPESRIRIKRTGSALEKVRVSLFGKMDKKIQNEGNIVPVNATSFYGSPIRERCLPLAPDTPATRNKKPDTKKSNLSLYDLPNKKVAKKRRSVEINSGVGHSIKKFKCKVAHIKNEHPSEANECLKQNCKISQKENVGKGENSQNDTEYYNPNKKFFKHKRPDEYVISVGTKPRQMKYISGEKPAVSYSNVFGSSKSKKQYFEPLCRRASKQLIPTIQTASQNGPDVIPGLIKEENSCDPCETPVSKTPSKQSVSKIQSNKQDSPDIIKEEYLHDSCQTPVIQRSRNRSKNHPIIKHSPDAMEEQNVPDSCETPPDTPGKSDFYHPCQRYAEYLDEYISLQRDIANNNFGDDEEMTDTPAHEPKESENPTAAENTSCFMESLSPDAGSRQNNFEEITSTNSEQSPNHDVHSPCKKCNIMNGLENEGEEQAGKEKIVILRPSDRECCKEKAYAVLKDANQELSLLDEEMIDRNEKNFFIYVKNDSIVGILVAEKLDNAFQLILDPTSGPLRIPETFPVDWGVKALWVLEDHRRQGIATKMMDVFRYKLLGNCDVSLDKLAFAIPSTSGRLFAEKYMGTCDLKVY